MTTPSSGARSTEGPTALRMLLGAHLRRLREAEGISRYDAGYRIRSSESKISRMELGRVSFKERDVNDLLEYYGVDDEEERERLLGLTKGANTPGWWHRYGDVLPSWFQSYLGLESTASLIRTFEIQFVPGLLQTREYAEAIVSLGNTRAGPQEIKNRVELRVSRRKILTRDDPTPPMFWTVIDEAALRRPIGGPDVMRAQLEALIQFNLLPNVQIQIIPFAAGGHAADAGAFTLLRFSDPELPDIVFHEHLTSGLYLDKPDDVDLYTAALEALCIQAAQPSQTPEILHEILASPEYS